METLVSDLRPGADNSLWGLVLVFGGLLGFLSWSDIYRDRYVPDVASLGLLFAAIAVTPLLWDNLPIHYIWAGALGAFVIAAWFVGAWADGDMKILLAYAVLLGPLALPALVLACFLILLYSVPVMLRALRSEEKLPRGQRLGVSAGVPGIALALPLVIVIWTDGDLLGLVLLGTIIGSALLSALAARLATDRAEESI